MNRVRRRLTEGLIPLVILVLAACSSVPHLPIRSEQEISVGTALEDIAQGFFKLKQSLRDGDVVLGLYPCRIEIALNVKAGRTKTDGLVVGTGSEFESILKLAGEYSEEVVAERGNTVEIEMYNPACLPRDTLGYEKPEMIDEAMDGMGIPAEREQEIEGSSSGQNEGIGSPCTDPGSLSQDGNDRLKRGEFPSNILSKPE